MSLTLIMALILPSYATVGASDGSAFVTKAEFDAALSDFNARLTTFEAGINSKIDSQVSSYLDRNGIWQGKGQTVETSSKWNGYFFIKFVDSFDVTAETEPGYLTGRSVHNIEPGGSNSVETEPAQLYNQFNTTLHRVSGVKSIRQEIPIVKEVTKTGLCLIDYEVIDSYDIENTTGEFGNNNRLQWQVIFSPKVWTGEVMNKMVGSWGNHDYWILSCSREIGTINKNGTYTPKTSRECFYEDYSSVFAKAWGSISWVGKVSGYDNIGTTTGGKGSGNGVEDRSTGYVTHNKSGKFQDFVFVNKGDKLVFHYEPTYHITAYGPACPYLRSGFYTGDVDCFKVSSASVY